MDVGTESTGQNAPPAASLAKATGVALLVAAVVLVTAVLPAEYGIDPIGAGRAMGITSLVQPAVLLVGSHRRRDPRLSRRSRRGANRRHRVIRQESPPEVRRQLHRAIHRHPEYP
jgi:hypothetical protein